jgi:hypothetical protein
MTRATAAQRDRIARLLDEVRELAASDENRRRLHRWELYGGHGRRVPKRELLRAGHTLVSTVVPNSLWSRLLGMNVRDYYNDPATLVEQQLCMKVFQFCELPDDNPIDRGLGLWLGSGYEASLFGVEIVWLDDDDPWVAKHPVVRDREDISRLPTLDFKTSGMMPLTHRIFEGVRELLPADFTIGFPDFYKAPFGLAMQLHGMAETSVDLIDNPELVRDLLRLAVDVRKWWCLEREKLTGCKADTPLLDDDEVYVPLVSPSVYRDLILPFEQELDKFHDGIGWWHTCGDLTELAPFIRQIRGLQAISVSPWCRDLEKVVDVFRDNAVIEVGPHPMKDITLATEEEMAASVRRLMEACRGTRYLLRVEAFSTAKPAEVELAQAKRWIAVAQRLTKGG